MKKYVTQDVMNKLPVYHKDGQAWYPSQEVAIALGVEPKKVTGKLAQEYKRRFKVGVWPMERLITCINAAGLALVWRRFGQTPIHELVAWLADQNAEAV